MKKINIINKENIFKYKKDITLLENESMNKIKKEHKRCFKINTNFWIKLLFPLLIVLLVFYIFLKKKINMQEK